MTPDPLRAEQRYRQFLRRMITVSITVGLLVAVLAPTSYLVAARAGLRDTASALAEDIADDVAEIAAREPHLWRYNVSKVVQATSAYGRRRDLASVRLLDCDGAPMIRAGALGFTSDAHGPHAFAAIEGPTGTVGFIEIVADVTDSRIIAFRLSAAGTVLGILLAWVLVVLPARIVRRQYDEVADAGTQLRRAHARIEATNATLEQRVEAAVAEVRELSDRAVRVQEEERARIARDLHDTLGQHLSAQRLELDALSMNPSELAERSQRLLALNGELLDDLRRTIRDLRPAALDGRPLDAALGELAENFEMRTGVPASTRFSGLETLGPDLAAALFRVAQEALTNVARHAEASEISLRAHAEDGAVELEVRDDGRGGAEERAGHGLRFMRHRVQAIGGTLDVESPAGQGTTIRVRCALG